MGGLQWSTGETISYGLPSDWNQWGAGGYHPELWHSQFNDLQISSRKLLAISLNYDTVNLTIYKGHLVNLLLG
jgi:hypothetical protein